jgi:hypothetical protein
MATETVVSATSFISLATSVQNNRIAAWRLKRLGDGEAVKVAVGDGESKTTESPHGD